VDSTPSFIVGDADRVWSLLPVASCGPPRTEAVLTGIRRKTGSTEAISRKHSRTNALASETVKTRGHDRLTSRLCRDNRLDLPRCPLPALLAGGSFRDRCPPPRFAQT